MQHSKALRWSLPALVFFFIVRQGFLLLDETTAADHQYEEIMFRTQLPIEPLDLQETHQQQVNYPTALEPETATHFGWTDPIYQRKEPRYDKEEWMEWKESHSEILKNLRLPTTTLGNIILPDKLTLPNNLSLKVQKGVLFAGTGKIDFCLKEMVPAIAHLRHVIGIPDAAERGRCRAKKTVTAGCDTGFILVASQEFTDGPLRDSLPFFDAVFSPDDLPNNYPIRALAFTNDRKNAKKQNDTLTNWLSHVRKKPSSMMYTKAIKVHAMASSPFNVTIMMDFDSRPCRANFVDAMIQQLNGSDIAMTNKYEPMHRATGDPHLLGQHNSAVMVLNMESVRTRILLSLYIQAFHSVKGWNGMDQPSLMVALRAVSAPNHKNGPLHDDPLRHVDLP